MGPVSAFCGPVASGGIGRRAAGRPAGSKAIQLLCIAAKSGRGHFRLMFAAEQRRKRCNSEARRAGEWRRW